VAFVGQSGCGKSTTIQLIQRFYDVNVSFRSACLAFGCQAVTDTCIVVNCYGITTGDISCGKYSRTIVFFMFHLNSDEICYILRMPWLVAGGVLLFYAENLRLLLFWQMLHLLEKLAIATRSSPAITAPSATPRNSGVGGGGGSAPRNAQKF